MCIVGKNKPIWRPILIKNVLIWVRYICDRVKKRPLSRSGGEEFVIKTPCPFEISLKSIGHPFVFTNLMLTQLLIVNVRGIVFSVMEWYCRTKYKCIEIAVIFNYDSGKWKKMRLWMVCVTRPRLECIEHIYCIKLFVSLW